MMRSFCVLRRAAIAAAALASLTFFPCLGTAKDPVDLSGRIVPLRVATESDIGGDSVFADKLNPDATVTAVFKLGDSDRQYDYGLFVPAAIDTGLFLNGRRLDIDPYHRTDGDLLFIPRGALQGGENALQITRTPLAMGTASWVGLAMFSLTNTTEEFHFTDVFADEASRAARAPRAAPAAHPSQSQFDVLYYDCYWEPSMSASSLTSASVLMRAKVITGPLQTVGLDLDTNAGAISVSRVDQGPGTSSLSYSLDTTNNWIVITLPSALSTGQEFQVRIVYSGTPRASYTGYLSRPYTRTTHNSIPVVYTASQPYGARRWWPCKDRPDDKATTTVQRIAVPSGQSYKVVSNGRLVGVTAGPSAGLETWTWESTYPITTYLVSLSVSNYVYSTSVYTSRDGLTTMPISHAIYPENVAYEGNGAVGTLDVLNTFAGMFGEYPFLREKYGTATWNISFGIEHQTCTGMPGAVQYGTSESVGDGYTRRNMHELAHMWYGDKVTYATFDHVWLGEAFATYAEALWQEHVGGSSALHTYVNNWTYTTATPIVDPSADGYVTSVTYRRGAWVLHMLRHVIGDTAFFQTLKDWTTPPPPATPESGHRSTYSASFEQTAETVSGKDLTAFFAEWLYRPNADGACLPDYRFEGSSSKTGSDWHVSFGLEQVQTGTVPFTMPLDVKVSTSDGGSTVIVIQNAAKTLTSYDLNVGSVRPVEVDMDPDNWVLNSQHASVNTVGLPAGATGVAYSRALRASGGSGTYTWTLMSAPAWLTLSSGVLSGTPPAAGSYGVTIQFQEAGVSTRTFTLTLDVADAPPPPPVVINEALFDVYNLTDAGEYIELKNTSSTLADISGWQVVLVDGASGNAYATITIPASTTLAGNDYYVIANAATLGAVYPGVVDLSYSLDNALQDGAPDAIVLKTGAGVRVDSLNYRADTAFASGSETANAIAEGGTGRATSRPIAQTTQQIVLGRLPDGADTGRNLNDFACVGASPGSANAAQFSLPLTDSFDSGAPDAAWRGAFVVPRTADPTASGKPGVASPQGGQVLEVFDSSGGGDVALLPAAMDQINFEGYLWTPQDVTSNGWSTGVGIDTRDESTWFSATAGNAIEHGFYLEYQNGPLGGTLKGGVIPAHAGILRFYAVDGTGSINTGIGSTGVTQLGTYTVPAGSRNAWNAFKLSYDKPKNRLIAVFAGVTLYDGVVPAGNFAASGGIVVGFREIHTGGPSTANREGTWVDGARVTSPSLLDDLDGDGVKNWNEDKDLDDTVDAGETSPRDQDSDDDGFEDGVEVRYGTDPLSNTSTPPSGFPYNSSADTDGDRYRDFYEYEHYYDPSLSTSWPPLGDANSDGTVNNVDVTVLRRIVAETLQIQNYSAGSMDLNRDGTVNNVDVTVLRRFVAGTIPLLP
jgi:aminopeptidase N